MAWPFQMLESLAESYVCRIRGWNKLNCIKIPMICDSQSSMTSQKCGIPDSVLHFAIGHFRKTIIVTSGCRQVAIVIRL